MSRIVKFVTFNLHFHSNNGDIPHVVGSHELLGDWGKINKWRMTQEGEDFWTIILKVPLGNFEYKFLIVNDLTLKSYWENGANRILFHNFNVFTDRWNETTVHLSAVDEERLEYREVTLYLQHHVGEGESVYVVGECFEMGIWKYNDELGMKKVNEKGYKIDLLVPNTLVTYKYIYTDQYGTVHFEEGPDRELFPDHVLVVDTFGKTLAHDVASLDGGDNTEVFFRSNEYRNVFNDSASESKVDSECSICCEPAKEAALCTEGCAVCVVCLRDYLEKVSASGSTSSSVSALGGFGCIASQKCAGVYTEPCIQRVLRGMENLQLRLNALVFRALLSCDALREDAKNVVHCPFCEYFCIMENIDDDLHCQNPLCLKVSCRTCHKESHRPQPCKEVIEATADGFRKYVERKMNEAKIRYCPCGLALMKEGGCNFIICKCGRGMCYSCRAPLTQADHFSNSHFGNENNPLHCRLFEDSLLADEERVCAAKDEAIRELQRLYPACSDVVNSLLTM